jgi:hypothetical protein
MSELQKTQPRPYEPRERIASAREVTDYLRDDCRPLRDSLQLEMAIAQYCVRLRQVLSPEGVPVGDAVRAGVVAELERHADPLSHAILRGFSHLGTDVIATMSADAAARLADAGVGLASAFADVGEARAAGAWRAEGGGRSEYALFAEFEHPLGARHSVALFVEPRRGGTVKHLALLRPMSDVDPGGTFDPAAMEALEISAAGALLRDLLDRSFGPGLDRTDDFQVLIAAARARSMLH